MTDIRDAVMAKLHRHDPWAGIKGGSHAHIQGWNSSHRWLAEMIDEIRPQIAVEIGVWKGASVAMMANKMREMGLNGVVIAVDTWLGSSEHWVSPEWADDIPTLYSQFLTNIAKADLTDYVVPVRLDSLNAARLLGMRSIFPKLIHLDAGHDFNSVSADLAAWWPLLSPEGVYIGDDYHLEDNWPEVKQATDQFFLSQGIPIQCTGGKCRVRKLGVDGTAR